MSAEGTLPGIVERVEEAIRRIAKGQPIVVIDDEDRENEGDLVMAAENVTADSVAFYVRNTTGLICAPLSPERCAELELAPMTQNNSDPHGTAFVESVDFPSATTTGVSAADRAATVRALADPMTQPSQLSRPGHVFPLAARRGGVLKRAGHTEAAIDLMRLAGCQPAAMICEIVLPDGEMARQGDLETFAGEHGLALLSIGDLVAYRYRTESLVKRVASAALPTRWGDFESVAFASEFDDSEHLALVRGSIDAFEPTLVRVHSECLTGDIFHSRRCDCGEQLEVALEKIAAEKSGVVVYLRGHEGRGIGLSHKIRAYALQDHGSDTVDANLALGLPVDGREYGVGAQILRDLGVRRMRLMTNNPAKYRGLTGYDLEIVDRVPLLTPATPENVSYLNTKRTRLGHLLERVEDA